MHPQMIQPVLLKKTYGIIQIFGILTINGNHAKISEIHPAFSVAILHMIRHPGRLIGYFLWEVHGKLHAFCHGQYINSRLPAVAQHLNNFSLGTSVMAAVLQHLNHYFLTVFCLTGIFLGNKDFSFYLMHIRFDKTKGTLLLISSHQLGHSMSRNGYHLCLGSASSFVCQRNNLHFIFMKSTAGIFLRDKIIQFFTFHFHKAKTLGMADEGSFQMFYVRLFFFSGCLWQSFLFHVSSPAIQGDLIFLHQAVQHILQILSLLPGNIQKNRDLSGSHRHIGFGTYHIIYGFFSLF